MHTTETSNADTHPAMHKTIPPPHLAPSPLSDCIHPLLAAMKLLARSIVPIVIAVRAIACEGPCIVGVTEVWVSNYTAHVEAVFKDIVRCVLDPPLT